MKREVLLTCLTFMTAFLCGCAGTQATAPQPRGAEASARYQGSNWFDTKEQINDLYACLSSNLCQGNAYVRSAIAGLDYWGLNGGFCAFKKIAVKTKEGHEVEVLLLNSFAVSMPGSDFSMTFLVVDGQVVDWKSCLTYNRFAQQDVQVEDVDGDGYPDLSFRYNRGWFGWMDERKHTLPGDDRIWLYAYRIESDGFKSIFPEADKRASLITVIDTPEHGIDMSISGLPEEIVEHRMYQGEITICNNTDKVLGLYPRRWFKLEPAFVTCSCPEENSLQPGEKFSQKLIVAFEDFEGSQITLKCRYIPAESDK
jgi:hypothetical protein